MNLFSPELLVLSGRIALLVAIASVLAFFIGWMLKGRRPVLATATVDSSPKRPEVFVANDELIRATAFSEELGRNLAATETQCVQALEQRDEAERQAILRATEVRKLKDELAALMAKETVSLETHQSMMQQLQSLQDKAQEPPAFLDDLERQLEETRKARETREREYAEARQEAETLRQQIQAQHNTHDGAALELSGLKQQIASTEDLASRRLNELEQLAKEKTESEALLKARIAELEARTAEVAAPPPVRSVQLPKPPLPLAEVLAAPVDETLGSFPPAPEAAARKPVKESLFDDASVTSFAPEAPSLVDARATLAGLEQELQEKDQLIEVLTAEQAKRTEDLESVRHSSPEGLHDKLHGVEKAAHMAAARLNAANSERERSRRQVRALTRSLALAAEYADQADDLTRIKGIKGGISQQLHAFGIFTYRQIVAWDAEDMLAFSELLAFKNRLHRDKWQEQARALMEAKYGKELQS